MLGESALIGKTIKKLRTLTEGEAEDLGWDDTDCLPTVIILSNDTMLIPMQDPEGNGPGAILVQDSEANEEIL